MTMYVRKGTTKQRPGSTRTNSPGEVEHHDGLEDLPAVLLVQRHELLKQRGRDSRRQLRLGHGELREPGDLLGAVAEVLGRDSIDI